MPDRHAATECVLQQVLPVLAGLAPLAATFQTRLCVSIQTSTLVFETTGEVSCFVPRDGRLATAYVTTLNTMLVSWITAAVKYYVLPVNRPAIGFAMIQTTTPASVTISAPGCCAQREIRAVTASASIQRITRAPLMSPERGYCAQKVKPHAIKSAIGQ